jgi:HAD superfamily hydrolase (TIGR01509 family)
MIRAVIFDCFGVVVSDGLNVMCSEFLSDQPESVKEVWSLVDQTNRGALNPDDSSARIGELFGMNLEDYRHRLSQQEVKDQQLLNYIRNLRKEYKTAMLSNIGAGSLARRFDEGELEQYFDTVVASGDIGYAKPEPEAYEITAERLGVSTQECVFIDDRENYCEGARQVGMQTIIYQSFAQAKADLEKILA